MRASQSIVARSHLTEGNVPSLGGSTHDLVEDLQIRHASPHGGVATVVSCTEVAEATGGGRLEQNLSRLLAL